MSVALKRYPSLLVALVVLLGLSPVAAHGQETDATASALEAARLNYENRLEAIRRDVRGEIAKLYKKATREDDPVAARERVEAIENAFEAQGTLPELPSKKNTWGKNYNTQKDQLEKAYAQEIERYRSAGNDGLVVALSAEQELFAKQLDLVPWGANLIESPVTVSADKPLEIDAGITGEYRIEIHATRTEGEGTLWVELPVSDQRRVRVPLVTRSDGSVRTILTVTPELVSADMGVVQTNGPPTHNAEANPMLVITAEKCESKILVIKKKYVIYGEVEIAHVQPGRQPRARQQNPGDRLVSGLALTGERITGDGNRRPEPNATIESRTGDVITLITERLDGKGKFARTIRVGPNGSLTPIGLINRGGPLGNFTIQGGGGKFDGTVFRLQSRGTWSAPNSKNNAFNDELILRIK